LHFISIFEKQEEGLDYPLRTANAPASLSRGGGGFCISRIIGRLHAEAKGAFWDCKGKRLKTWRSRTVKGIKKGGRYASDKLAISQGSVKLKGRIALYQIRGQTGRKETASSRFIAGGEQRGEYEGSFWERSETGPPARQKERRA